MSSVAVGKMVPDFTLPATGGESWRLKDARGQSFADVEKFA